jgi:hypothetical protein
VVDDNFHDSSDSELFPGEWMGISGWRVHLFRGSRGVHLQCVRSWELR